MKLRRPPFARLAVVLMGALFAAPLAAQIDVDPFTAVQSLSVDATSSGTVDDGSILGGERDGVVRRTAGAGAVTFDVTGGAATFAVAASTQGLAFISWDGNDNDALVLDPDGLAPIDLTAGNARGFQLRFNSSTANASLRLEVFQGTTNVSQAMQVLPASGSFFDVFVDFSEFVAVSPSPADFTQASAIRLSIFAGGLAASSVVLDRLSTALPALDALKADFNTSGNPLIGPVQPGTTYRYRVTITNTGTEAQTVNLEDALDANLGSPSALRTTPIAHGDHYQGLVGVVFDSSAMGEPTLVANDTDPDGNAVAAIPATGQATTQGGSVNILATGHFVYTPPAGFSGVDSFTYQIAPVAGDPTEDALDVTVTPVTGRAQILLVPVPPTLTAGGTLVYTENDPATPIDTTITVTDPDSNVAGASAQITANYVNGEDILSCGAPCTGLNPTFVPGTGTFTLTGSASPATYQTALRGIAYNNTSDDPSSLDRTVTWIADDGFGQSAPVNSTIDIVPVNDAPVVTTSAGDTSFIEDGGAVIVDAGATVSDVDDTNLESATVTITNPLDVGLETLSVTSPGATCPGLAVSGPGTTLTIGNSALESVYQTCLQSVRYNNTSQNPNTTPRSISFVVNDGTASSAAAFKTVTVTPVNDPPIADDDAFDFIGNTEFRVDLGAAVATPATYETTPSTFGVLDGDTENEGDAIAVTSITVGTCTDSTAPFDCTDGAVGTVHMQTNGRFSFEPAAGDAGATETFTYVVSDNGTPAPASDTGTVTLTRFERVWYVDPTAGGGGTGTSLLPFNTFGTLNGAGGAGDSDVAADYIYVQDGTLAGSIEMENSQHLIGEGVQFAIPVNLNGNGSPTVLRAAGAQPQITAAAGDTVRVTTQIPIEIVGLSLGSTAGNSIDLTSAAALTGSANLRIGDNQFRSAGAEGIDVNLNASTTGTLNLTIQTNSWNAGTHTGNAVDINRAAGTLNLDFSSNTGLRSTNAAGAAVSIDGGVATSTTITGFFSNTVHESTVGSGILVSQATFDAVVGGAIDQVDGGTTQVGVSGDGAGVLGMSLTSVGGNVKFDDLRLYSSGGAALNVAGLAGAALSVLNATTTSAIEATGGPAIFLNGVNVNATFQSASSTNSSGTGVSILSCSGSLTFLNGTTVTSPMTQGIFVDSSTLSASFGNTSVTGANGTDRISLQNNSSGTRTFGTLTLTGGSGVGFLHAVGGGATTAGTTTVTNPVGIGISIASSTTAVTFGSTTIDKGTTAGTGLSVTGSSGPTSFSNLAVTTSSAGSGVLASSSTLSIAGSANTIASTGGPALDLTTVTLTGGATFATVTSTNSAGKGINLDTVTNALTMNGGSVSGSTGVAFDLNAGAGNVTYTGPISKTSDGNLIEISSRTGGTVSLSGNLSSTGASDGIDVTNNSASGTPTINFSGATKTLNTATSTAVQLDNNDVATINFTGGNLDIDTTSGNGFSAINGAVAISVQGSSNTIATGTGTALNVANSTIGAAHLNFTSIAANGGANGIFLQNTCGAGPVNCATNPAGVGGLIVDGDGANTSQGGNGTGGTIQNMSGADLATSGSGIYLDNTLNIVLRRMTITGTNQNFGIRGFRVHNLTMEYMTVSGTNGTCAACDNYGEGAVMFGDDASVNTNGVTGSATVRKVSVSGGLQRNFSIVNTAGTLNRLTITGMNSGAIPDGAFTGNQALAVEARNAGTVANVTVDGSTADGQNTFTSGPGGLVNFTGQTGTTMDVVFNDNALSNNHPDNIIGSTNTWATQGVMTISIFDNSIRDSHGSAVTFQKASAGTSLSGTFNNNTIGVTGIAGSGSASGNGIFFSFAGGGVIDLAITNNQIRRYNGNGAIFADNTGGTYDVRLDVTGNFAAEPGAGAAGGFLMAAGAPASADDIDVCVRLGGAGALANNFSAGEPSGLGADILLGVSTAASSMRIVGNNDATPTAAELQTYVLSQNPTAGTIVQVYVDAPATFSTANFPQQPGPCGAPPY